MDARPVERLVGVDVSDAREQGLVEQGRLDGASGSGQHGRQPGRIEFQGIGAKSRPDGQLLGIHGQPEAPKPPRISEDQPGAIAQPPCRVDVGAGQKHPLWGPQELAGHAQVDADGSGIVRDDRQGFPLADEFDDLGTFKELRGLEPGGSNIRALAGEAPRGVGRPDGHVPSVEGGSGHCLAHEQRQQAPAESLDFGEFGHARGYGGCSESDSSPVAVVYPQAWRERVPVPGLLMGFRMDRPEFEAMAIEHLDAVYRLAYHLTRSPERAEELVQDVYLRALRSDTWENFAERGGGMRAWLFTIAHNSFYSDLKKEGRRPTPVGEFYEASQGEVGPGEAEPAWDRARFDWDQVDDALKSAIEDLKPEFREILLLWGVEGLKYREIAEILEVPIGTVMSRLHRARKLVAEALAADPAAVDRLGIDRLSRDENGLAER